MQAVTGILRTGGCVAVQRGMCRISNVIAAPPRVRISFAEKAAHGLAIAGGVLITPIYILGNIKNYTSK